MTSLIRRLFAPALAAAILAAPIALLDQARAEGKLRIAEQFGISYLPLHVIRDQGLIEKHGKAQGVDITVSWEKLGGGASVNDALLSGSIDVGAAGIGPLLTIWDKTKGNAEVKGIAALSALPFYLVTRNANVKTLKDFTKTDRIALPAVGVSVQARTLQIAAEKEFGVGKHNALDDITVTLAHPDATNALLSGATEITAHFSSAPFQQQVLSAGKAIKVLSSYEVLGGPVSSNILYTTSKFRSSNPKTYAALLGALKEATAWINANKEEAAKTYIRVEKSTLPEALIRSIVEDPNTYYRLQPDGTFAYAEFLHRIGAVKTKAASWKDYFFDDVSAEAGN
jgi:NitT/TauT family transport system substrate-binding protein